MLDQGTRNHLNRAVLPTNVGVGYRSRHFPALMEDPAPVGWLEIHAENYMSDGGKAMAQLRHLAEAFPISVHGVGLSIGGEIPLDKEHLARLKKLCDTLDPASFSEHLAWSTHESAYMNDLLPLPYTKETLGRVATHIDQVQDFLGRQMLLENPSTYLAFKETEMSEIDFLTEIVHKTSCGLLLDVNNVYVSCTNQNLEADRYIDDFPLHLVGEIHLAGHEEDQDDHGMPLLIDTHDREVVTEVWDLYKRTIDRSGPIATLIEWDSRVPEWSVLAKEAERATHILDMVKV